MNDMQQTLVRSLLKIGAGMLVSKGLVDGNHSEELIAALMAVAGVIWGMMHRSGGAASANSTPSGNGKALLILVPLMFVFSMAVGAMFAGCSTLDPGANALVVRAEQTEAIAHSTFVTFLQVDNADRDFMRTNAPGIHKFAEFLRQPVTLGTNTLPRDLMFIKSLDDVKLAYKRGLASSNEVVTVIATVETALVEAQEYLAQTAARGK